jgi:hypothetical protein
MLGEIGAAGKALDFFPGHKFDRFVAALELISSGLATHAT